MPLKRVIVLKLTNGPMWSITSAMLFISTSYCWPPLVRWLTRGEWWGRGGGVGETGAKQNHELSSRKRIQDKHIQTNLNSNPIPNSIMFCPYFVKWIHRPVHIWETWSLPSAVLSPQSTVHIFVPIIRSRENNSHGTCTMREHFGVNREFEILAQVGNKLVYIFFMSFCMWRACGRGFILEKKM